MNNAIADEIADVTKPRADALTLHVVRVPASKMEKISVMNQANTTKIPHPISANLAYPNGIWRCADA